MRQRQAVSAYGRRQNATRMERRDRTATNPANGLLSRQFASITDVLFKASQRRNQELQELQQRLLRPVPTPPTSKPANEPLVVVEPELWQGSDSGDDLMMLAELHSSKEKRSGSGVEEELGDNDELARMMAGVRKFWSSLEVTAVVRNNDSKSGPAGLGIDKKDELSALAKRLGIDSNESEVSEDAKSTLDDLYEQEQASDIGHSEDEDDDLETLRGKLATMFSPSCHIASQDFPRTAKGTSIVDMTSHLREDAAEKFEPECTPSTVALRLEAGDVEREDGKGWCTKLFSDGLEEQDDKKEMLKRENERLEATIKYVLEEEKRYRAIEETKLLPNRLIVSNLAADADDEAIRMFFAKYRTDIRNVTILARRDPVKRTRTAYVDMYSRKIAVLASYEVGGIFELIVKIKLAVESEGLEG